jgi:nucleotide-binding universal stress UspA family protein
MVRKILVVVDDRPVTQSAIEQATEMAQVHQADIFFFGVLPHFDYPAVDMLPIADVPFENLQARSAAEASRLMAAASALAEKCGVHSHRATSVAGDLAHAVADAAVKRHCDLIVVGNEDNNAVLRLLNGSIVPGLISKSTVPVLVCRGRPRFSTRKQLNQWKATGSAWKYAEKGTGKNHEQND